MSTSLRVLILEDRAADAELVAEELQAYGIQMSWTRVDTEHDFRAELAAHPDLILADHALPQFDSMRALKIINELGLDVPFILVSGSIGEDLAVAVMRMGAADYLLKDRLARLGPAVTRVLEQKRLRDDKRRADQLLRDSEERFHSLFENTPVAIWEEDFSQVKAYLDNLQDAPAGDLQTYLTDHPEVVVVCVRLVKVIDLNRASLELHGAHDKTELLGHLERIFTPESYVAFQQELVAIEKGAQYLKMDDVVQTLDGQRRDVTLSWVVAPGHEKTYSRVLLSTVDITERKRAEEALRQSEERFRALIEHSSDAIALADAGGTILYASPAAYDILGLTSDRLVGKSTFSGIHPDDVEQAKKTFFDLVSRPGESVPGQFRFRHQDGTWRWVEGIGTNLLHVPGVRAMLANYRNITERKQRERELEAIATISAALRAAVTRAEMLPIVLDQVRTLLDVDSVSLMTRDPLTGETIMELGRGVDEELIGQRLPAGAGIVGHVIATGQPYVTNDVQHDPLFIGPPQLNRVIAVACLPLITHEQTIGGMWARRQTPFTESEVRLLSALADIAANAIHRAALFEAERDQRTLAESLRDSASALSSTLNFDEVLDRILVNAGRVVPHDTVNVMLVDAERGVAHVVRHHGYEKFGAEAFVHRIQFVIDQVSNLQWMARTGQPLVIPDVREYAGWIRYPEFQWIRSFAGTPLRVKGQLVGFLGFDSSIPDFYTPAHAERMQAFADQAAVAIENARLYQEIRRYAEELETHVADRTRELTAANMQLAAANQRLQELDQLKSKFVSDVSHELRTPVTSLKLYTELLDHGKPERQAEYRRALIEQANRLMQLVEDILNLSRLELGASRIQFEPVQLNTLVEAVVVAHQPSADAANLQLSFTPDVDLPHVRGEPNQLAQVVTNLLTNAINYAPQGMVQVRTFRRGQRVCLEVQDSGMGIDPGDLPHLFDRFYRGARAVRSKIRGTGLGLAIVKEIVDLHGGEIEVESQVNVGTTFRVWLPIAD